MLEVIYQAPRNEVLKQAPQHPQLCMYLCMYFFYFLFRPFPSCCFLSHLMRIECCAPRSGPLRSGLRIRANRDDFAANRLGHMPAAQHSKQYIKDKAGQPARKEVVRGDEDRPMYSA